MHIIGLRNIKTMVAIFVALITKVILMLFFKEESVAVWYTPFFAGIAAAYSVNKDVSSSLRQAKIRSVGSVIGGVYGILIVLLVENVINPFLGPGYMENHFLLYGVSYAIYSIAIVGAIALAVGSGQASATFITCLTYLSVTVSIRNGGQPFVMFGINRILSTIVGVFIAVLVNLIKFPKPKNRNVLFIAGLDSNLLLPNKTISGFTLFKLNSLCKEGAKFAVATTRTPSSINKICEGLDLRYPMIIMDGAACYDFSCYSFNNVLNMPKEITNEIDLYFKERNIPIFAHSIADDDLHIYHGKFIDEVEKEFYNSCRNSYFDNYVNVDVPKSARICYYVMIKPKEEADIIVADLMERFKDEIFINNYEYSKEPGYYYIKIHSIKASKVNAIDMLNLDDNVDSVVAFGSNNYDIPMLNSADVKICFDNATPEVKQICDYIIQNGNPDKMVRMMDKLFHGRNIDKKFAKIKEESSINY